LKKRSAEYNHVKLSNVRC